MDKLSKTAADATREKEFCPPSGVFTDSLSHTSYNEYPARCPLINTYVRHTPQARTHQSFRPSSPSKAFPETSSAAILSALRNLQEKIRRLELQKGKTEVNMHTLGKDGSHMHQQSDKVTRRLFNDQTDTAKEKRGQSNCNQVLISHLAAAESRCVKLERQLDYMRGMLRSAKADRTSPLTQQVSMETAKSADKQSGTVSEQLQLEKLERLELEYRRLTRTQNDAELKIRELEMKLEEEEHQRKLVQDKAKQLQTGLEANRILLQSVSPCLSSRQSKEKNCESKKASPQESSCTQPHYRLSLRDVPFVAGTSVGCSHSVRANVQSVLSQLKRHQPHLCNSRVLSNNKTGSRRNSDSSSTSSSASEEELSELLQALQEELRLMSLDQEELMRQVEASVSSEERKELQREQETLLLKMERKGEQIRKLYRHKTQVKKFRKEAGSKCNEVRVTTTVSTRGRSAGSVNVRPGERSKRNLRLLRDMKALQTSLRT
ncbi:centrosomal protein of 57 kDa isoform X1 [Labrus mixtus]|uniref:centrosomal protein of 57 kDa isoform X1 n=1 Tax=Labrus mixtus TaxID=508554 RepID=UPI0029BFB112|nr:centrosomal protein of 57 kDa isoform X1 [Labrus mixtus]XP_060902549.1 centrosomal protein of 57 kDa isoform X1 [Labrus mixtus]